MMKRPFASVVMPSLVVGGVLAAGCTVTHEEESSARKKQQAALNDPFRYGPDAQKMQRPQDDDVDPTDITGGDTANLNRKALKRDWDKVIGND